MAFSFNTVNEFVEKTPLENKMEILQLTHQAQEAYSDLLQANVNLSEVDAVIENIYETLAVIQKDYVGPESVEMLGLKDELFPNIEKVSRLEAVEGLGEALKKAWDKLVEWISGIFKALFNFLRALVGLGPKTAKKCDEVAAAVKENPEEAKEAIKETEVTKPVMTPEQDKVNTEVQKAAIQDVDSLIKLQDTLEKRIQQLASQKEPAKDEDLEALFELAKGLEDRIAGHDVKLAEMEKAIQAANEKATLAEKKWSDPNAIANAAAAIKESATKDAQTFSKKMEEVNKRKERIMKILTGAAITLVCPVGGIAYGAYQLGKAAKKKEGDTPAEGSSPAPEEKKAPKASPEFASKLKNLVAGMGKKVAGLGKVFSRTRKHQEQQVDVFVTVLTPVTKEEVEEADSKNVNDQLKKKQEEAGLASENLKGEVK